jgi:hypothetical protein
MSEWIDFAVYAAQAIVLWMVMPRWGARMALPMMRDRNAAWVDAHPDALAHAAPGAWFLKACYAWGALTVLVLLTTRLGLLPQDFLPHRAGNTGWQVLMSTNNILLCLGFIGYFSGAAVFMRWLKSTVPPSQLRQASLQPRVIDDYVPRWFRLLVYVAIVAHLSAWLYVGAADRFRHPKFWPEFTGILALTTVMFVLGHYSVQRRRSQMDALQRNYRRIEIRLVFAIQLVLVGLGAIGLCKVLYDIDLQRFGALAFDVFVVVALYSLTRPHQGRATGHTAAVN